MKRILLLIILSCWWLNMSSAGYQAFYFFRAEGINPYERYWKAVTHYESNGNIFAYNPLEQAYGPGQIRQCKLNDYNLANNTCYTLLDCFKYEVSTKVFMWHCLQYNTDIETIVKRWNGSGPMTEDYWKAIQANICE